MGRWGVPGLSPTDSGLLRRTVAGEGSVQLDLRWDLKEVDVWISVVNLLIKSTNDIFLHRIVGVRKAQGAIDGLLAGCWPEPRRTSGPQPQKKGLVTAEPGH